MRQFAVDTRLGCLAGIWLKSIGRRASNGAGTMTQRIADIDTILPPHGEIIEAFEAAAKSDHALRHISNMYQTGTLFSKDGRSVSINDTMTDIIEGRIL